MFMGITRNARRGKGPTGGQGGLSGLRAMSRWRGRVRADGYLWARAYGSLSR